MAVLRKGEKVAKVDRVLGSDKLALHNNNKPSKLVAASS
jgi:hypothetical protein